MDGCSALAKFKFTARKETELSFDFGDVVVLAATDSQPAEGWFRGHLLRDDEEGKPVEDKLFPSNYVEPVDMDKETYVFAVALYDFEARNETELSMAAGDSLTLINPDYQSSYITAQNHGRRGLVPADYVELAEYCEDGYYGEEGYEEEPAEEGGDDVPPPVPEREDEDDVPPPVPEREDEDDVPPPVPERDDDIPPPVERPQKAAIRKLNVIRTLRRGTVDYTDDGIPPPLPNPAGSAPKKSSFIVSAPPSSLSQKYAPTRQDSNAPPIPSSPLVKPAGGVVVDEGKGSLFAGRNKRLSLPPVGSNTDLFSLLEDEEAAMKAEKEAEDQAIKTLHSDEAVTNFTSARRAPAPVRSFVGAKPAQPMVIDAATDAKLAAFASATFEPVRSRDGDDDDVSVPAPAVPVAACESGAEPKKNKRYSMLLPTDMNGVFEHQNKSVIGSMKPSQSMMIEVDAADAYQFEEADGPENIQYKSSGELAGATFMKMLAFLTKPSGKAESQRLSSIRSFVECFRMFCTPEQFFEKVRMRFLSVSDGSAIVQKNCVEVLLAWTQTAFAVDLLPNKELFDNVQSFLDSIASAADNMSPVVCQAARHVQQLNKLLANPVVLPEEVVLQADQYVKEPVARATAFLKASATDIAHQLCLIQHKMLMRICPVELVRDVWMAEDSAETLAPHLSAHVDFCNQKTLWLQELVVTAKKDSERKKVISHIIDCAEQCLAANNFNGMMIFLSAVQSRNVKPFEKLFSSKAREKLDQTLLPLIANDCRQIRTMQESRSPSIPYVDTWLADMAVLNRNTPDKLPDTRLINWSKIQLLGMSLRRLQNFQHEQAYTYPPKRPIIALIHAMKPSMKEEQVFALAESLLEKKKK